MADVLTIKILLAEDNSGDARLLREMLNEPAAKGLTSRMSSACETPRSILPSMRPT